MQSSDPAEIWGNSGGKASMGAWVRRGAGPWSELPGQPRAPPPIRPLAWMAFLVDRLLGRIRTKNQPSDSFGTLPRNKCGLWKSSCFYPLAEGAWNVGEQLTVRSSQNHRDECRSAVLGWSFRGWRWGMNMPLDSAQRCQIPAARVAGGSSLSPATAVPKFPGRAGPVTFFRSDTRGLPKCIAIDLILGLECQIPIQSGYYYKIQ